jgi:unsaturated rhamnogalacturonyl hydrolase
MKRLTGFWVIAVSLVSSSLTAQELPHSVQAVETVMRIWPDSFSAKPGGRARWSYDQGVLLKGVESVWRMQGDGRFFQYIQHSMDYYVREDGSIHDYKTDEYNIDHINNGKVLLFLYAVTGKEKYWKAIQRLYAQVKAQPRNQDGGFWHKKIYPNQMWLDGLYMGQPFYAEAAWLMRDTGAFNDITRQFVLMETNSRDAQTGLLYHAWDASKQQRWANPLTGRSPHVWARAMGWYGCAMVDVLDHFPRNHPGRDSILQILNRYVQAISKVQRPDGLWWDVLDMPDEKGNYPEASASAMFVYTLFKAARKGYIPATYLTVAHKGYKGIQQRFLRKDASGLSFTGTVSVSGLGGNPYRDGSFAYYMSEPVIDNDPKGLGAFILCAAEAEMAALPKPGKGKTVLLDRFFNNETKKDILGNTIRWHYTWEDQSNGGFRVLGNLFEAQGAQLKSLDESPTLSKLTGNDVYIIVDPDHPKDNPQPNYVTDANAKDIAAWVKAGGVLLLLANDSANCDLVHINKLTAQFGIQFTNKSINMVQGNAFEQGTVKAGTDQAVFTAGRNMYLKELSVLRIQPQAKAVLRVGNDVVMAVAKHGKGWVAAIGDPWLYNEYVDGRKLPKQFENHQAARELIFWLLSTKKMN